MTIEQVTIEQAAESLSRELAHYPWLSAVGIGERDDKEVIFVYVTSQGHKVLDRLKREGWHGFDVVVEKIGRITPAHASLAAKVSKFGDSPNS